MLFRFIATAASIAFIAQGALAQLTIPGVATNIDLVTDASQDANDALSSITPNSSPDQIRTAAQSLVQSFNTIINDVKDDTTAMKATPRFTDCTASQLIVNSLDKFVLVHQVLLSTVIGKQSIFAQFFLTAPVVSVLRTLEATIDAFAFAMIDMLPTCNTAAVQTDKDKLDGSVKNTITNYEKICIPNPLYPKLMPICVSL